jgi:glutamine---fructose-6-phosphate transaminase (isomerizing)
MPAIRAAPPFLMTEMIEAEPDLAVRILQRARRPDDAVGRVAAAARDALERRAPLVVTGCGTSEHAAMAVADQLREAALEAGLGAVGVRAEQAFELALDPPQGGLVIGVSHEGGSWATNRALETARAAGARTAMITAAAGSPGAALADTGLVVSTDELDQSWCHTVAYVSAIVAGAAIAGLIAERVVDPDAVRALLAAPLADTASIDEAAESLAGCGHLVVVASGADRPAGRELVLKVEEGAALRAAYRDVETFLHGHLAGIGGGTGVVLLLTERRELDARVARARQLLAAVGTLDVPAAAIVSAAAVDRLPIDLTPAGRIVVPDGVDVAAPTAALLSTSVPLQLLTERLARARGTNPDPIRRDDPRYLAAAAATE